MQVTDLDNLSHNERKWLKHMADSMGVSMEEAAGTVISDHFNTASGKRKNNVFRLDDYRPNHNPDPAA